MQQPVQVFHVTSRSQVTNRLHVLHRHATYSTSHYSHSFTTMNNNVRFCQRYSLPGAQGIDTSVQIIEDTDTLQLQLSEKHLCSLSNVTWCGSCKTHHSQTCDNVTTNVTNQTTCIRSNITLIPVHVLTKCTATTTMTITTINVNISMADYAQRLQENFQPRSSRERQRQVSK